LGSDSIILVDLIGEVVDSMRAIGEITSSNETATGVYSLESVNELRNKEVVTVDGTDYIVTNVSDSSFTIKDVTGEDFTGKSWKALAPYYEHGHPVEINKTLMAKTDGIYGFKKYPLIITLQDFEEVNSDVLDFYSTASISVVIVNKTEIPIKAAERYDLNYRTILYPLYDGFLDALYDNGGFNIRSSDTISHNKRDAPYYGSESPNGNTANIMSDPLDAIIINNLELQIINPECNNLK